MYLAIIVHVLFMCISISYCWSADLSSDLRDLQSVTSSDWSTRCRQVGDRLAALPRPDLSAEATSRTQTSWNAVAEVLLSVIADPKMSEPQASDLVLLLTRCPLQGSEPVRRTAGALLTVITERFPTQRRNGLGLISSLRLDSAPAAAFIASVWTSEPGLRPNLGRVLRLFAASDEVGDLVWSDLLTKPTEQWQPAALQLAVPIRPGAKTRSRVAALAIAEVSGSTWGASQRLLAEHLLAWGPAYVGTITPADEARLQGVVRGVDDDRAAAAWWVLVKAGDPSRMATWMTAETSLLLARLSPTKERIAKLSPQVSWQIAPAWAALAVAGNTPLIVADREVVRAVANGADLPPALAGVRAAAWSLLLRGSTGVDAVLAEVFPAAPATARRGLFASTPYGATVLGMTGVTFAGQPPPHILATIQDSSATAVRVLMEFPEWVAGVEVVGKAMEDARLAASVVTALARQGGGIAKFKDIPGLTTWLATLRPPLVSANDLAAVLPRLAVDTKGLAAVLAATLTAQAPVRLWSEELEALLQLDPAQAALDIVGERLRASPMPEAAFADWVLSLRRGKPVAGFPVAAYQHLLSRSVVAHDVTQLIAALARCGEAGRNQLPVLRSTLPFQGWFWSVGGTNSENVERLLGALDRLALTP